MFHKIKLAKADLLVLFIVGQVGNLRRIGNPPVQIPAISLCESPSKNSNTVK
jgi:hypothetical protein